MYTAFLCLWSLHEKKPLEERTSLTWSLFSSTGVGGTNPHYVMDSSRLFPGNRISSSITKMCRPVKNHAWSHQQNGYVVTDIGCGRQTPDASKKELTIVKIVSIYIVESQ